MRRPGGFEIERELEIARPPSDVFDFLADTASFKAVDPALVEFEPEGTLTLGMAGRFLHRRSGLPARSTWVVTAADPPRRLAVEIQGSGYGMTETADLEATQEGSRVHFVDAVWPTSLAGRVMVALSGAIVRRDLAKRSALLKAALEGAPPAR
jgi:carbon monoxide dehydrogenase subunit G